MNEPATLNFLDDGAHDTWVHRMTGRLVVESLLEIAPADYTLRPGLAEKWTESADHRVTTFTLRTGATFSDGTPLEAADVVATLDVVMDPKRPTGATRGELTGLASWKALDARTVELSWATPSPFTLRALARLPIYGRKQLAGDWAALGQRPLGTGPFVIASWERGVALTLTRRPGGSAHLEKIVFRFVKDPNAANALFEKGEFDLMTAIQPATWRALEQNEPSTAWARRDWHRIKSLENAFSYIGWNEARPVFRDVQVRQAMAHLYDAALITRVVDLGLEVPTTCPFLHGSDSCSAQVKARAFSVEKAKALLADAGWLDADGDGVREKDGVKLQFTFLLPGRSVRLGKIVPMLQEQLQAAGARLEVEQVETTTLSTRVARRDFDVVSRVWNEADRELDLFQLLHSSQIDGGSNFVGYSNGEADRLIEQIRGEFDVGLRRSYERHLHERLANDQPFLLMTARQSLDAAKRRVHGLQPSLVWYDLRGVWVTDGE
ncbi:MAG: ABC transporter substrate-binding protein [Myxococcota bacterium]